MREGSRSPSSALHPSLKQKNTDLEVSVLLVGEGLDWAGVDGSGHVLLRHGNGVLCHDRLSRRGVGRHEHALRSLAMTTIGVLARPETANSTELSRRILGE